MSATEMTVRRETGLSLNEGQTVLGERQVRIPTAGKIRPGIMRLTQAAAKNPAALKAYDDGVSAGKDWQAIALDVRKAMGLGEKERSPMTPQNVPYFTVRRSDFVSPEIADTIMQRYGEDRGDGFHLYRFPVVFPIDHWQAVLPHALKAYTKRELVFWSSYQNGVRVCLTRGKPAYDEKAKRYARPFGGRPIVARDWNDGVCNPEQCPEYQTQKCKLSGSLIFFIPGIPGGALELPTTSFYSMQGIRQQLEIMMAARGRIAGLFDGQPLFYLAKRMEEVSMFDVEKGEPVRTKQWITVLETMADMTHLLTAPEEDDEPVEAAIAVLEGPADIEDAEVVPAEPAEQSVEELQAAIKARVASWAGRVRWSDLNPYLTNHYGEWTTDVDKLARIRDELDGVTEIDKFAEMLTGVPF